jgi:hypothetical protein
MMHTTAMRAFPVAFAVAVILAACGPSGETGTEALDDEVAMIAPEALHATLIEEANTVIPSNWSTGEPAPDTALAYWHVPPTLEDIEAVANCMELPGVEGGYECTLSLTAPNYDADEDERRGVEALYRMEVGVLEEGGVTLLSPNVRWAVRDVG